MEIKTSNGFTFKVDVTDATRVKKHRWYRFMSTSKAYCYTRIDTKMWYLQRFVMKAKDDQTVQFLSGDTMDCRKKNLLLKKKKPALLKKPG